MSRVVVLEPHPDDAVLFACFSLLRYQPHVVTVLHPHTMAEPAYPGGSVDPFLRLREHEAAMAVLGTDFTLWPFSDISPDTDAIADMISELDCDLLLAPAVEEDGHPDHNLVGSLAQIQACEIIQYTTYTRSGGRTTAGRFVPYEFPWAETKRRAMACYESQAAHPATASWFAADDLREWVL